MCNKGKRMGESIVIELTAKGKGSFSGRTMRVAALLLLFGLLAPPGGSPGPARGPRHFHAVLPAGAVDEYGLVRRVGH